MVGESPAFRTVLTAIARFARFDVPVLIEGETGTGKEVVARAVHYSSARSTQPFVPVNCGALPETLVENELFGHRRGAFTDAREDQPGLVTLADGGTLFLDEIDALSPKAQVTLLRFLQDQTFRPLGGRAVATADVRVIAATNADIVRLRDEGRFRADVYYRLDLLHLRIPPLRERREDVALLANHFLGLAAARFALPVRSLAPNTLSWLERYRWPGNVRELEHLVYRAALLTDCDPLVIPAPDSAPGAPTPLRYRDAKAQAIAAFEASFIAEALNRAHGNVSVAARLIGTERRHLGRMLRKHGLRPGVS